jgi:hypothetical protein
MNEFPAAPTEQKAKRRGEGRRLRELESSLATPPPAGDKEYYISTRAAELSEGSNRSIRNGRVRQNGPSREASALQAAEEWSGMDDDTRSVYFHKANGERSSAFQAAVNPASTPGAGRGTPLGASARPSDGGTGFTGVQGAGKNGSFQLRTPEQVQARKLSSLVGNSSTPVSSVASPTPQATGVSPKLYDIPMGGQASPTPQATGVSPKLYDIPMGGQASSTAVAPSVGQATKIPTAQPGPVTAPSPAAQVEASRANSVSAARRPPGLRAKPSPATPPSAESAPPPGTPTPEPAASNVREPRYGEPGFKTNATYATGMTPELTARSNANTRALAHIAHEAQKIKNPFSRKLKEFVDQVGMVRDDDRQIQAEAKRNAAMQNETMSMTAQGMQGPPRAAQRSLSALSADPSSWQVRTPSGTAGARG